MWLCAGFTTGYTHDIMRGNENTQWFRCAQGFYRRSPFPYLRRIPILSKWERGTEAVSFDSRRGHRKTAQAVFICPRGSKLLCFRRESKGYSLSSPRDWWVPADVIGDKCTHGPLMWRWRNRKTEAVEPSRGRANFYQKIMRDRKRTRVSCRECLLFHLLQ